jgi:hypothetical protein
LLLDPAVVSFLNLQVEDDDEYEELAHGIALSDRVWLAVPINDNSSFGSSSSHWSIMICCLREGKAYHFDSSNNYNFSAAKRTLAKISRLSNL